MLIKAISYVRNEGTPNEWRIEGAPEKDEALSLGVFNLIIGQNATGKTNTLNIVRDLADIVSGEKRIIELIYKTFRYDVLFEEDNRSYHYSLNVKKASVVGERLEIDDKMYFDREEGKMFYESQDGFLSFQMAPDELGITRRDSQQQSYLDPLFQWGKNLSHYEFGGSLGKNILVRDLTIAIGEALKPRETDKVSALFAKAASRFGNIKKVVMDDMRQIGYQLTDIKSLPLKNLSIDAYGIAVKEIGLDDYTDQQEMSQGMFRALSIIIQIEYSLASGLTSCILIDDIGEGLDYERSQKLIQLILKKAARKNLQVIMTSNDRFVMNSIPLQYWQVINRNGNKSVFYNMQNSKKNFDEFSYTGLNNFDFFANKFYLYGMEAFAK